MDVVPVVLVGDDLDDLDEGGAPLLQLMHAVARYADGGDFADAGRLAAEQGALVDDPILLGALEGTLALDPPGGTPLRLSVEADQLGFAGLPVEVLSPGQREVLGLGRALLDPRWEDRQLGIVTYSERSMDPTAKRACWNAVTVALQTPDLRLGSLRTLLVAVRAPTIVWDTHCSTKNGARYVLEGDRLVPRSFPSQVRRFANEAARSIGRPLVFFLGAGFSRSSSLPLGNALRDQALRRRYADAQASIRALSVRLFREAQTAGKLTAAQTRRGEEAFADELTLEQVVALETVLVSAPSQTLVDFSAEEATAVIGPSVAYLTEMVARGMRPVLVTVNFDELIERAAGEAVRAIVTEDEFKHFPAYLAAYMAHEEDAVPLLKLHGTISNENTCVINAAITEEGLPEAKRVALKALAASVQTDADARPLWIYVGASLRDVDVVPVLAAEDFAVAFEEAWVMPLRAESIEAFAVERLPIWQAQRREQLDARVMSATADAFFGLLKEAWDTAPRPLG